MTANIDPSLLQVRARVAAAAALAKRDVAEVTLIAISKTRSAVEIEALLGSHHIDFGENRVSESEAKWPALRTRWPEVRLHFIGQLQSNKASHAVASFDIIHSVDRPSLVEAIGSAQSAQGRQPGIFLQVNLGDEAQKAGCKVSELPRLLMLARDCGLDVMGLMAIPPAGLEPAPYFALLAKLGADNGLRELSMGMSSDFETAIRLGATHVRVGTALFGPRP